MTGAGGLEEVYLVVPIVIGVLLVGWILVEAATAAQHLTAAARTLRYVAPQMVRLAWRHPAVTATTAGPIAAVPPFLAIAG